MILMITLVTWVFLISITNILIIEKHDLKNNFTIQSHNTLDFENDDFTTSLNYMIMDEFEYWIFSDNEMKRKEKIDDVMYLKKVS
jgi:hypothetical protein